MKQWKTNAVSKKRSRAKFPSAKQSHDYRVLIYIQVYNGEKFLRDSLDSIDQALHKNCELLIVDDASTDNSLKIIEAYSKSSLLKVNLFTNLENRGVWYAYSQILGRVAKDFDYVLFVGQDDKLPSNYLEKMLAHASKNKLDVTFSRLLVMDQESKLTGGSLTPLVINHSVTREINSVTNVFTSPGVLVISNLLQCFDSGLEIDNLVSDWMMWLSIPIAARVGVCPLTNYYYRAHVDSLTSSTSLQKKHETFTDFTNKIEAKEISVDKSSQISLVERLVFFLIKKGSMPCRHRIGTIGDVIVWPLNNCRASQSREGQLLAVKKKPFKLGVYRFFRRLKIERVLNTCYILFCPYLTIFRKTINLLLVRCDYLMGKRKEIKIYIAGGLAAQLNTLCYAIYLKEFRGFSPVIVHTINVVENYPFEISFLIENEKVIIRQHHNSDVIRSKQYQNGIFHYLFFNLMKLFKWLAIRLRFAFVKQAILLEDLNSLPKRTRYLIGYPPDVSVLELALPEIRRRLSGHPECDFFTKAATRSGIAIHWRLGDLLRHEKVGSTHGIMSATSFKEVISKLGNFCSEDKVAVFSDSPRLARELLEKEGLQILDLDQQSKSIWADLNEMSKFSTFIGSPSYISIWASLAIGNSSRKHKVFLPEKWFKQIPEGFDQYMRPIFSKGDIMKYQNE